MRGRTPAGTAGRRVLIDAEDFARARAVAALQRGDSLALEDVPRRPNAALAGGVVLALLLTAGAAATAFVTGRAPRHWHEQDTLVLDRQSGARFVVDHGLLRPAPTVTSALLAGASRAPMLVPHEELAHAVLGPPLPGADAPERPPSVPAHPRGLVACAADPAAVAVWSGEPRLARAPATGLLVSPPGSTDVLLLAGRRAHPIVTAAMLALGYSPAQVRTAPSAWLALVPRGVRLAPLALAAADPAVAVPGVGADGDVVTADGSDERLLVQGGQVHPFLNRTSALLAPPPVRAVPQRALAAAPHGAAVGLLDAPTRPPLVPAREDVVTPCVRSSDGLVTAAASTADAGTRPTTTRSLPAAGGSVLQVTWHVRPGEGALVGPSGVDVDPPASSPGGASGSAGARVVADGVGYPLADLRAMTALGWTREQALPLPDAWLRLAAPGPVLATSR